MEGEVISRSDLGGSLPVENVQALASKHLKDIPHRYIRPEVEFDEVSVDESWQIPVIDMSKLGGTDQLDHDDELAKLHHACKDWGFFQLINHGISEAIEEMKKVTEEFFQLPLEEKMACAQIPNNLEGYGQTFVVSEDQKLDWGDTLFLFPLPVSQRNMRFWPTTPTAFRSTLDKYSSELQRVAINLLRLMAMNLRILSNGEYSSIEHRAMVNPKKERLSIAGFHYPNMNATVGPLPDLVKEDGAKYKNVIFEDYAKLYISSKLDGKRQLDHMKIKP
ncbi:hypothetical protein Acr_24g0016210 [Actinidia rufa]|uniref:2-oxoglutarate (2OG) and Fe(II)-dependent oxygenase superfamily protein n=1 Tax=Actinidia rufa TaxID=165716 RepID=A0A7J0GXE8_9ERIC|nr:hypothetical protein Acr_24g0016210 [Actinidia rufa]